jgi:enoyl-[acyl-carrier protein] reductase I
VHCLAFANKDLPEEGARRVHQHAARVFQQACDISAYSLIALARAAAADAATAARSSAMTYLGANKVVPGYNVMGVAKAALESTARYLAFDLGEKKIRVNTISAGPVRRSAPWRSAGSTRCSRTSTKKAPLKRNIDGDEVGKTAVYLLSDLSSGVTGENLLRRRGFNNVGL